MEIEVKSLMERGRDIGMEYLLMIDMAGELIPSYANGSELKEEIERWTSQGYNVVSVDSVARKDGSVKIDPSIHVIQKELADKVIDRLNKWLQADRSMAISDDRAVKSLSMQNLSGNKLTEIDLKLAEEIEFRAAQRHARLELVGDILRYLAKNGFKEN